MDIADERGEGTLYIYMESLKLQVWISSWSNGGNQISPSTIYLINCKNAIEYKCAIPALPLRIV